MGTRTKIMIVEDEGIVAKDLQNRLQSFGYAVPAIAASGKEALVKAADTEPDLVLMDIRLKGEMDGIETAERIRATLQIPVVYSTAYADDDTLERAKLTEPFGYVLKPFEERELYSTIEMALYKNRMERRLIESERWLATVLQSIGDGVIATDESGGIKFMNLVAETLTGWSRAKATGKPLTEVFRIVNEHTREPCENPVEQVMKAGMALELANHALLIARNGEERCIADSGAPIRNQHGDISGIVIVFRDVTMKNRMEEELARIYKLESVGQLAGGIAHDFNNYLTAILGNISLAKMRVTTDSLLPKLLDETEKASLRARDLTHQLLTFARGGAPIRQTASIAEIVKDSANFVLSGSNVRCSFSIADDLWPVEIDQSQVSQALNNIILNADQAMPKGGVITITCGNIILQGFESPSLTPGDYVKITIADKGHGITKEHISKVFDPYFTTKEKGRGLGLTTCHSIISQHDGQVSVESKPGRGAIFTIYLPASRLKLPCDSVEVISAFSGRILVMDDEEMVRTIAGAILKELGFEVVLAADGSEALARYREAMADGRRFSAVILDLTISGGMGGKDAVMALLDMDPQVKAIVSSGYSTDPIMAEPASHGFCGVIAKPYKIEQVVKVLKEVL